MKWQATTILARLGKAVGLRRKWRDSSSIRRAMRLAQRASEGEMPAAWFRAYERALAALNEEDRFRFTKLTVDLDPSALDVAQRGLASGAPSSAVFGLIRAWKDLTDAERELALGPVREAKEGPVVLAGAPARQMDDTTCGAAAMAIMLMVGDPFVGIWVASGRSFFHYLPPEVARIPRRAWMMTPQERWEGLQKSIHVDTVRRGFLLLVPWPKSLGTPPWRVDNHTRFLGLRFHGGIVDDTDETDLDAMITRATAALIDGIPVPIYASGDSSRGLDTVVPRHVVLLTHILDGGFLAYEPASAAQHFVSERQLREGGKGLDALGHWSHISWMVLPKAKPNA
ncbi:MAG: hypothetical protein JW722_08805 [Demequinaceae bacterium]|nr:hypothetical protein [Demequinaceae bacterium]